MARELSKTMQRRLAKSRQQLEKFLLANGAWPWEDRFDLPTPLGNLSVHWDCYGGVFSCMDDTDAGYILMTGVGSVSGKWNFHYSDDPDGSVAVRQFCRRVTKLLTQPVSEYDWKTINARTVERIQQYRETGWSTWALEWHRDNRRKVYELYWISKVEAELTHVHTRALRRAKPRRRKVKV